MEKYGGLPKYLYKSPEMNSTIIIIKQSRHDIVLYELATQSLN
jgi:hypothetical protein